MCCKESVIADQVDSLLSKDRKIDELRKLLSKNRKFLEQQEEMDRLINEQRQVIASLSKEIKHVRSKTLTDFELSFSSMKDTLTLKNEMIAKQQKEMSYLKMEYIQLMEDYDYSEVRILKCFYPWPFDLFNAMDHLQFFFFLYAAAI